MNWMISFFVQFYNLLHKIESKVFLLSVNRTWKVHYCVARLHNSDLPIFLTVSTDVFYSPIKWNAGTNTVDLHIQTYWIINMVQLDISVPWSSRCNWNCIGKFQFHFHFMCWSLSISLQTQLRLTHLATFHSTKFYPKMQLHQCTFFMVQLYLSPHQTPLNVEVNMLCCAYNSTYTPNVMHRSILLVTVTK